MSSYAYQQVESCQTYLPRTIGEETEMDPLAADPGHICATRTAHLVLGNVSRARRHAPYIFIFLVTALYLWVLNEKDIQLIIQTDASV